VDVQPGRVSIDKPVQDPSTLGLLGGRSHVDEGEQNQGREQE